MEFLSDKREYVEKLMNRTNLGILVLESTEQKIVFANTYFMKIAGSFADEIVSHIFKSIGSTWELYVYNTIRVQDNAVYEYMIGSMMENSDRFIVLVSDASLKEINLERVEYEKYYRKLSKFASEITHEAGNPLTSVIMTLQVLMSNIETWGKKECKEYLNTSIKELKRLSSFIQRIRRISVEHPIRMESIDISTFFNEYIGYYRDSIRARKLTLKTEGGEGVIVRVDVDKLNKIIKNLIRNSIQILPEETGKIIIRVEEVNEFYIKITYENNGPSFSQKELDTIFIPSISENTKSKEFGLDLSLKLMIRMDGLIKVENKPDGKGVNFNIFVRKA